jgi:predicted esterase
VDSQTRLEITGPHRGQSILMQGTNLSKAQIAVLMIHGRGATARSILELESAINLPGIAYVAPQAANNTWYPYPFLAPLQDNEPHLSSALAAVSATLETVLTAGVPLERVALLGFSQGACLAAEFAARHAQRYGAIFILSGGLIGPPGTPRNYSGAFQRTPVFVGCSDVDSHIPLARVQETTSVFMQLGAEVNEQIYPGMGHTINNDELQHIVEALDSLRAQSSDH